MILVRIFGGFILFVNFFQIWFMLIGGGFYTYYYARFKFDISSPTYTYLTYASYILWALAGFSFLICCFCLNSIKIGISVFRTTAQFLSSNPLIFLIPTFSFFLIVLWILAWIISAIWLFSVGNP
jgi:hypothetical protein